MSDWPEFDAIIRKKEETKEQAQMAAQESEGKFQEIRSALDKLVLHWGSLIEEYLSRIADEVWDEVKWELSRFPEKGDGGRLNEIASEQIRNEKESSIYWLASYFSYSYRVTLYIKGFVVSKIVVKGKTEHVIQANETELKEALLLAYKEGPHNEPTDSNINRYDGPN